MRGKHRKLVINSQKLQLISEKSLFGATKSLSTVSWTEKCAL